MHAIIVKLPDFAPDNQHIKVKSYAGTSWFKPNSYSLLESVQQAVYDHIEHLLPGFGIKAWGELPDGSGYAYIVEAL